MEKLPHLRSLGKPLGRDEVDAECANGGYLRVRGNVDLAGRIGNVFHVVPYKDMAVSMPIASTRQELFVMYPFDY